MDPCFYFDEETPVAHETATMALQDWFPLLLEGAALALIFAASAIGFLNRERGA